MIRVMSTQKLCVIVVESRKVTKYSQTAELDRRTMSGNCNIPDATTKEPEMWLPIVLNNNTHGTEIVHERELFGTKNSPTKNIWDENSTH
jgi:hypothetical protein